ncbi:unnamed protein product [Linum trigynum]|uniref:C2 NT-type domain-containing protein n=1 Tax=Linum trigynum TaxID=586398 RepID=A0AAV2EZM6_9ROSI
MVHVNAKNKKNASVQLNYIIHIEEIKPWPPSQSLRSLRSVLIQWEHGDHHSGSTNAVVPTIGTVVGEGKIEFNESFRLPVTLVRDLKAKDGDVFKKNRIEFNLCEPRRENKAQLLATAVVDLADYGVVKNTTSASALMKSTRSFTNSSQPVLFIKIQPARKGHPGSKVQDGGLSRGVSLDRNGGNSVLGLMNEEFAEEAELSTVTDDDDVSSHSSMNNGGLPAHEKNEPNGVTNSNGGLMQEHANASKLRLENNINPQENLKGSSSRSSSSVDLSSDPGSPINGHASVVKSLDSTSVLNPRNEQSLQSSSSHTTDVIVEEAVESRSSDDHGGSAYVDAVEIESRSSEDMNEREYQGSEQSTETIDEGLPLTADIGMRRSFMKPDRLKNVRSVRSASDSGRSNGGVSRSHPETEQVDVLGDDQIGSMRVSERKSAKIFPKDTSTTVLAAKMQQLEHKIKVLEGELREAAAIEAALYSVVAEHGSSISKVHAPARRLSRMYLNASGVARRASAARSAVSGMVLVAKSCGNDVPRLTFWLSNSVVLRAIISQAMYESAEMNCAEKRKEVISSLTSSRKGKGRAISGDTEDWEDPHTFISALERVEAWIFSRTVESIWWQTLTPHMQSAATKGIDKVSASDSNKNLTRSSSSCDQAQGNFSLELWKNAFKDACERLCPVRAGGHDCGCLPELARQVMEQCVSRLDVAMFNAILRESDDEIPTDPVSDPISDPRVLPIAAGISSFGAGAQLKNVIGNWSRWLTDLFGLDDDDVDPCEDHNDDPDEDDDRQDTSFKSFYLLNALSDLMMLPKDLLLSRTIRKEVCPTFGTPLIKRILYSFVSDEFYPDPVPNIVLEALESEDNAPAEEGCVTTVPCIAAPPIYLPSSSASVAATIGELGNQSQLRRSGSSVLRKAYTSDDELDELKSPLASIFPDLMSCSSSSPAAWKLKEGQNPVRYDLLREIWKNS